MDSPQIKELMDHLGIRYSQMYLTIPIPDGVTDTAVEQEVIGLKNLGYHVMVHDTFCGIELVITEKSQKS